jgi:hypothetical protein
MARRCVVGGAWVVGGDGGERRDLPTRGSHVLVKPGKVVEPPRGHGPTCGGPCASGDLRMQSCARALGAACDEQHATGSYDASELADHGPPVGHEVQDVSHDGSAERAVAERQPRGVGLHERKGAGGLVVQGGEHRRGDVDADQALAGSGERQRHPARTHSDLQRWAADLTQRLAELSGLCCRHLWRESARGVVEARRAVEGHRLPVLCHAVIIADRGQLPLTVAN